MEWETIGIGAGTGFVSSVLTLLGWNRRLSSVEEDIKSLSKLIVGQPMCEVKHKQIDVMQSEILKRLDKIDSRLDRMMNGGTNH